MALGPRRYSLGFSAALRLARNQAREPEQAEQAPREAAIVLPLLAVCVAATPRRVRHEGTTSLPNDEKAVLQRVMRGIGRGDDCPDAVSLRPT
ncbi:hypothetical protein [Sphingomonas sp.]|uniref:hypothetical protein n=1 Tax=Sphingomonas sp. TaxID=28214 RepID=UPI00184FA073|nr:hypothetical protein [Sphingomonas sp.]MBA3512649.1 hypothetical protein [Sphingomonas sp.]